MKSKPNSCIKMNGYLKAELQIVYIEFGVDSLHKILRNFLHFLICLIQAIILRGMLLLQVLFELGKTHFVTLLKFSILLWLFLDSVIGQVDHPVAYVPKGEVSGRCPNVTLVVPIGFGAAIDSCNEQVAANIELPSPKQHWFLHIFLDDCCASPTLTWPIFNIIENLADSLCELDTMTSIAVLAWLADPQIFTCRSIFLICL